ncbi:MAG: hypothetical protein QW622_03520 [Candidatus Pacearchaeota archaeon]
MKTMKTVDTEKIVLRNIYIEERKGRPYEKISEFLRKNAFFICGCKKCMSVPLCYYYLYNNSIISLTGYPQSSRIELVFFPKESSQKNIEEIIDPFKDFIIKDEEEDE